MEGLFFLTTQPTRLTLSELFRQVLDVGRLFPLLSHQLVPQLLHSGFQLRHLLPQGSPLLLQVPHLLLPQLLHLLQLT